MDPKILLEKIKSKGYWRVIIRPIEYSSELIKTLEDCKQIIKESQVSFRGWNYPYIDSNIGITNASSDSVHSYCDWPQGFKFEYWRFYKTGQFVHYFEMREDWELTHEKKKEFQDRYSTKSNKFLSILSTLYSMTEIFEFTSRLFSRVEGLKEVEIEIELHGVCGRVLFFWDDFFRTLYNAYNCEYLEDIIKITKTFSLEELMTNSRDLSLNETVNLFKTAFNWSGVNTEIFKEDQKKLLERRF